MLNSLHRQIIPFLLLISKIIKQNDTLYICLLVILKMLRN